MKKSKCIVSISHSDYLYRNAGTEKCMREVADVLRKNEVHYFQIFSFEDNSRLQHISDMHGKVGINYDNRFLGIYLYKDIRGVMQIVQEKYNVFFIGVHINNVLNHDYDLLSKFLTEIALPILVWVHDYTAVCPESPILLKNKKECCSNFERNPSICYDCCYRMLAAVSQEKIKNFYEKLDDKIWGVIAPSNNVKKNILIAYPNWKNRIHIRGHLKLLNLCKRSELDFPLRIAYVGGKYEHKGFREWEKIVELFGNNPCYELYYLGSSKEIENDVTSVFVDASIQGYKAMAASAINNKIDIAFLWSKCQETYSYTYYEMRSIGAVVITYNKSGNIAECVDKERSGLSFDNIDDLLHLMEFPKVFLNKINLCTHDYFSEYEINDDISLLIPAQSQDNMIVKKYKSCKIHKFRLLSFFHMSCNIYKKYREVKNIRGSQII